MPQKTIVAIAIPKIQRELSLSPTGSQWVINGYLLALGFCALLMWWPRLNRLGQLALLGVAVLFLAGFYSTLTRCVWLGAVAMLSVIATLTLPRSWRMPILGGVMLTGILVAATQWERLLSYKREEGRGAHEAAESVELRPILATVAWKMFLKQPLFGCGFGHDRGQDRLADIVQQAGHASLLARADSGELRQAAGGIRNGRGMTPGAGWRGRSGGWAPRAW